MGKKGVYNWKYEIGQRIVDQNKDITIIDRKIFGTAQMYKIRCNNCGFNCNQEYISLHNNPNREIKNEYWIYGYKLNSTYECPCCGSRTVMVVPSINDVATTDPWVVEYFQGGIKEARLFHRTSSERPILICPHYNNQIENIKLRDFVKRKYFCHNCGKGNSYPNRLMGNLLRALKLEFESEYSPNWIGKKRYDFYIPKLKLIVEMDGGLGHGNKVHRKSNLTVEDSVNIDKYKDQQAQLHGLEVIRIDCVKSEFGYIYNSILSSKLNELIDINSVDWNKIRLESMTSPMLQACKIYADGQLEIEKIAQEIGMKPSSVRYYLHEGTALGLCNYDTKKLRKMKACANSGSFPSQMVVCLNTLEVFDTITSAESTYQIQNVSMNCRGLREYAGTHPITHMPLVWAYYNDYLNMSDEEIIRRLDISTLKGRSIPVICLQTHKIYASFADAAKDCKLRTPAMIKRCCEGKKAFYGALSDGVLLQWMYYKEYEKLQQESQLQQDSLLLCANL